MSLFFSPTVFRNGIRFFLLKLNSLFSKSVNWSSAFKLHSCVSKIGPSSKPSVIFMNVIPDFLSPDRIACSIGDAPLHLGKREACILMQPYLGISRICFGTIIP